MSHLRYMDNSTMIVTVLYMTRRIYTFVGIFVIWYPSILSLSVRITSLIPLQSCNEAILNECYYITWTNSWINLSNIHNKTQQTKGNESYNTCFHGHNIWIVTLDMVDKCLQILQSVIRAWKCNIFCVYCLHQHAVGFQTRCGKPTIHHIICPKMVFMV